MTWRERKSSIGITAAASAALLVLSTSPVAAQGTVNAHAGGGWTVATVALGGFSCGDGSNMLAVSFTTTSCKGGPNFPGFNGGLGEFESQFITEATARAFKGSLGAESQVSWFVNKKDNYQGVQFNQTGASGNATARWDDRALFTVAGPITRPLTFMDITFRVTGGIAARPDFLITDPFLGTVAAGVATSTVAFGGGTQGSSFFSSQVIQMNGLTTVGGPNIPQFQTLRVGVLGLVSNPFNILLSTQSLVNTYASFYLQDTIDGYLQTLYNHTVTPVSYSLWDDQGADVTSLYGISFEQGLEFEAQQSVVPEPATVGMMALGMFAVFAMRRRRKFHG